MTQYFDHVRCPSCRAAFDPEKVATRGRELTCPACGETLRLADLFGLSAAFAEDDQPDLSLEDAIPSRSEPVRDAPAPSSPNLPGRPIDSSPLGALDVLKQLKKGK